MGCNHSSSLDIDSSSSSSALHSSTSRVGILPLPDIVNNYSDSSSSDSDDSDSDSHKCILSLSSCDGIVTTFDQSIDDDCSRESVVDWLATTTSTQSSDIACNYAVALPALSHSPTRHLADASNNNNNFVSVGNVLPPKTISEHVSVTQTANVERRHVALPKATPDGLTCGDFLRHRYCVNDYILLQKIGSGGHSEVRLSKNKATNALFAVKIMQKGRHQMVQQEIAILTKLSHPNVIKLYEVIDDQRVDKVYLILEYLQRGDLMRIVESDHGPFKDDVQLRGIVLQIMGGLNYLHENNILQNDLKPSNILLSDDGVVKIADFGVSTICRIRRSDDHSGTPAYMSPEMVNGDVAFDGRQADVYSLGATCFYLRFGCPPFVGRTVSDLYHQIKTVKLSFPDGEDEHGSLHDFISGLMEKDPLRRLCLKNAFKHPWLACIHASK